MTNSVLDYALFGVGGLLALFSLCLVGFNYSTLYINRRNRQRGNDKHRSMIFLAPQILLFLAGEILNYFPVYPVPGWLLLCIALADPGIWFVISWPLLNKLRK